MAVDVTQGNIMMISTNPLDLFSLLSNPLVTAASQKLNDHITQQSSNPEATRQFIQLDSFTQPKDFATKKKEYIQDIQANALKLLADRKENYISDGERFQNLDEKQKNSRNLFVITACALVVLGGATTLISSLSRGYSSF